MLIYLQIIESDEDKKKFTRLYHRYRNIMFWKANSVLNNVRDAEDAVQQAFVKVAEHIQSIDDSIEPRVRNYLVIIAEHKAIDIYRRKQRIARHEVDLDALKGLSITYEGNNRLTRCMTNLPVKYRQVMLLKYVHGASTEEIADLLDISTANVHKIHQRAKKKLEILYYGEDRI